jgi:hypothetical protein
VLINKSSTADVALMMIEKYPAALQHRFGNLMAIHFESYYRCRLPILSKCIELYPESFDDGAVSLIIEKVKTGEFYSYTSVLHMTFTVRPMSLYDRSIYAPDDIRDDPGHRRRILNLIPHHVFTPTHESDYRDLNWQPRVAMMMLLSQIKIQQSSVLILLFSK